MFFVLNANSFKHNFHYTPKNLQPDTRYFESQTPDCKTERSTCEFMFVCVCDWFPDFGSLFVEEYTRFVVKINCCYCCYYYHLPFFLVWVGREIFRVTTMAYCSSWVTINTNTLGEIKKKVSLVWVSLKICYKTWT